MSRGGPITSRSYKDWKSGSFGSVYKGVIPSDGTVCANNLAGDENRVHGAVCGGQSHVCKIWREENGVAGGYIGIAGG
ncbi:unnamed protein product [Prunus armeniaca]